MDNLFTETIKGLPSAAVKVGKTIGEFAISPLRPFGEDIGQLLVLKEYQRKYDDGEIAPETWAAIAEESQLLKKSAPQIVGDVAQSVLIGTPIRGATTLAKLGKTAPTIKMMIGQGVKTGAGIGAAFGTAAQLSEQPELKPGEVAGGAITGGVLGAGLGGLLGAIIPYLGKPIGKSVKLPEGLPQDIAGTSQEINKIISASKIKEPGLEKYALSPEVVFRKMGDEVWDTIGKPLLKTQDALQHKVYAGSQVIKSLQKELGTSFLQKKFNKNQYTQTSERIFNWLDNPKAPKGIIPQELQPLAQEARKYKSAEEFVRSQPKLYHGTNKATLIEKEGFKTGVKRNFAGQRGEFGEAVSLSPSKEFAGQYGKEVVEASVRPGVKLFKNEGYKAEGIFARTKFHDRVEDLVESGLSEAKATQKAINELRAKGFGGIETIYETGKREITIFDTKDVLTKSQLTDFYTQAVKGVKEVMGEITLSPKELSVATKMKQIFDNYADRLDAMRQAEGLPPINRIENYITHLINAEVRSVVGREGGENINQLIFNNIPREIFDPFLLAREGKLPMQKDIWKALRAYMAVTERKLAFDPVLKQIDANLKKLPTNSGVREYTKWFVNHLLGKPSDLETAMVNTTNRFLALAGKKDIKFPIELENGVLEMESEVSKLSINRISPIIGKVKLANYLSFIGSNIRTMLVNLTQPIGVAANLPTNPFTTLANMTRGYAIATAKLFSKKGWQEMTDKGIIQEFTNLMETEFSARGVLSDVLMWNMRISEFVNRVSSTYAGKITFQQVAKKSGFNLAEEEAILLGKELSNIVNFKYGVGNVPRMFANPIGQLYYQYMTFVLKQGELLGNMAMKLPKKNMMPEFIKAMEEGAGVDWLMTHKSPERLAFLKYWLYAGSLATALQSTGFKMWDTFTKGFIPNQLEALPDLVGGVWEGDTGKIQKSLGKMAAFPAISRGYKGLIPLREQTKRTLQFLEAWKTGQITDANEKVMEKEITKEEAFRRFLMGTYGTEEGRQRADTFEQIADLKTKYSEYRTEAFNIALNENNVPKANRQIVQYNKEMTASLRKILKEGKVKINPKQFLTLVKQYTINPITPQLLIEERMRRNTPSIERFLGVQP